MAISNSYRLLCPAAGTKIAFFGFDAEANTFLPKSTFTILSFSPCITNSGDLILATLSIILKSSNTNFAAKTQ